MRDKKLTMAKILEAVQLGDRFGANPATSHFCANYAGVSPQYATRILRELYRAGLVGYRVQRHRGNTKKRVYSTVKAIDKMPHHNKYSTIFNEYSQMELPL